MKVWKAQKQTKSFIFITKLIAKVIMKSTCLSMQTAGFSIFLGESLKLNMTKQPEKKCKEF